MRVRTAMGLALACALFAAPLVYAQVTNRYQVSTDSLGRGYPKSLAVVLVSPPDYVLDYMGRGGNDAQWKGPRYEATGNSSLGGDAGLGWSAGLTREPSNRQTIVTKFLTGFSEVEQGVEPIERRLGGRTLGTLRGTWVLARGSEMAGNARYQAGLVFPLCGRTALIFVSALSPASDSAGGSMGFGEYRIKGMAPSVWNRQQVLTTLNGISVDGSLQPGRIAAARRGRTIAGRITDCNRHPVAAYAVRLERRVGRTWRVASRSRTRANGSFALPARGKGPFRVVAGPRRSGAIR